MTKNAREAAEIIQKKCPHIKPKVAIVLGSGLGALAGEIKDPTVISYADLPGFHTPKVEGHGEKLYVGTIKGVPVACLQGRAHFYEGVDNATVQTMVRTLKLIGCEMWLATNASGSIRPDVGPGRLVVINDHINFQFNNPLVGPNDDAFGERFVPMEDVYDRPSRQALADIAKSLNIELEEGVYIGVLGPSFETPAEIRAFRTLGADVVGMSTVPEVIVARHCGMRVVVIAAITNFAVGVSQERVTHERTLKGAKMAADHLIQLVRGFIETL